MAFTTMTAIRPATGQVPSPSHLTFHPALQASAPHPALTRPSFLTVNERKRPPQWERTLVAMRLTENENMVKQQEDGCGLGIVEFLKDKDMLITGATGFVGKVLIEKILRSQPHVGRLFLLIQGPNQEAVTERLKKEIINAELFKCLKEIHGSSYQAFMLRKLVPLVGTIGKDSLGMEEKVVKQIAREVDVIVSCAANTAFDERYDVAMNTNTKGPSKLVEMARRCRKLKVFLHVSTAYVNGTRTGLIRERPFLWGDNSIDREEAMAVHSEVLPPILDIEAETKIINDTLQQLEENMATPRMKELGLERAKIHGWQNTYTFTKAMGEMVIGTMSKEIPTVIVRPGVIGSTIQEPFPGWIQGLRMADPMIVFFGKGHLPVFTADGKAIVDLVPVDMVVNASLAAMVRHGSEGVTGLNVYHIGTSSTNPLQWDELFCYCLEHFISFPWIDPHGKAVPVQRMKLFQTVDAMSSYLSGTSCSSRKIKGSGRISKKLSLAYEAYTSYKGRFEITNAKKLLKKMSREEKTRFTFDVATIDWRDYIVNVHIHGLRKHVMKRMVHDEGKSSKT